MTGCIVPLSRAPKTHLQSQNKDVRVSNILGQNKLVHVGMTKKQVHEVLAGVPRHEHAVCEFYGPFKKDMTDLYIGAWHGPHTWGIHSEEGSFTLQVCYDKNGVVESCDTLER